MSQLSTITQHLRDGLDLNEADCAAAAQALTESGVEPAGKKAFLDALHAKGESVEEVTTFAKVFRKLAKDPQLSDIAPEAIDIVGTGGSGSRGYNISSVTAFIVAASGSKVLKHGNRAITSQSGSADFLSAWGIRMDTEPELLRNAIEELNFCFFFAPAFHPAFKEIMPVRKEMAAEGKRSIFNILGPLINPAKPAYQLLGVFSPSWVQPLAQALHNLGLKRGLTVCCQLPGGLNMDEFTTAGDNLISGFGSLESLQDSWNASSLGLPPTGMDQLRGGTAIENKAILEDILEGGGRSGLVDTLVLNAAAAFLILEKVDSLAEGQSLAREILLGGALRSWLDRAQAFYKATNPAE
ncbi:anthranilate phosphoribosyltransferase [Puniceicoccales bacterium CK1056]|uniref:Anthranilate phosphoribosyltransferase n=1 Tax=Oceanipulchritudo coccoides TaxID=2706888 RepID=A0A6B2M5Q5_9BACT|nr:anthranilate phosphoribosyltransferase [Oceanipulchritudo coccoides]NDV63010.1 anthranilate phosphoribosyltransferase [Oceanipulchritudo coccoides]